eukprot:CAMPEP_0204640728 /NCGR_PEP_ID=MMETSP0717-20131115/48422_1 /ASSEMBLY_ACC=CAM_ASM_000666 /TAXON_ID=230516 /ORGANISM="Chaetoceros curvisetus" /LENGTH=158 /DNA_ID=CAMNT_0051661225 /DNA_START=40 /DNA_END=513 /DNA_ORIENTATION=+
MIWGLAKIALEVGYPAPQVWDIIVSCDGYSALDRALLSSPDRLSSKYKHYDLVSAIMGLWRDIPCSSFPVHVKSHQDDVLPPKKLSRLALMNIEVDKAAYNYMQQCVSAKLPVPPVQRFRFGLPMVMVGDVVVSSELYSELMNQCTAKTLREYWISNW